MKGGCLDILPFNHNDSIQTRLNNSVVFIKYRKSFIMMRSFRVASRPSPQSRAESVLDTSTSRVSRNQRGRRIVSPTESLPKENKEKEGKINHLWRTHCRRQFRGFTHGLLYTNFRTTRTSLTPRPRRRTHGKLGGDPQTMGVETSRNHRWS